MTNELWSWRELVEASDAVADGEPTGPVQGFSIDTRAISPGDVFVALMDRRDGHAFVSQAFAAGAVAAVVRRDYVRQAGDGALLRTNDPLAALRATGAAARRRLAPAARVFAVTGSAGKTGTKEMLRACLSKVGRVHASEKSFNNHWGVPLTLARMAAATDFAVFEIGMNHAGEISRLTAMVRPHVAIVTTVEPVHLEHFASVEAIADAKAEIFEGFVEGGVAIVKRDSPHFSRLAASAARHSARVVGFGFDENADVRGENVRETAGGTAMDALWRNGVTVHLDIAQPGRHVAENALAVAAAIEVSGAPVDDCVKALAVMETPPGRGRRTILKFQRGNALLIDESYNANPASMRAALTTLASVPRSDYPRRIAVLADMFELGPESVEMHLALRQVITDAGVDQVFSCGALMHRLHAAMSSTGRSQWAPNAGELEPMLFASLQAGDVVMIKGSNGMRLGPLIDALSAKFA